jgi:prepilin-type N-terminal cleavage/methylation domain-containing protein
VIFARRGVTLIELLVAMALAGLVATFVVGWILHAARMSHASQVRDDRDQSLALVRKSLFEDGSRGHVLEVSSESWTLERPRGNSPPDTVRWSVADGFLVRDGSPELPSDSILDSRIVPAFSGEDLEGDPWSQCDLNLDGMVDDEFLSRLTSLEWTLHVRHPGFPNGEPVEDTIRLAIPLQGPG